MAMVTVLRPHLTIFVFLWLSLQQCCALDNGTLPWRLDEGDETQGFKQLMECETLNISLPPDTRNISRGDISYYVLALERRTATLSHVGYEPSSLRWKIQHPAGAQLFVALLDSSGTSLGFLPHMYTVIPGAKDCLTKPKSPGTVEAAESKLIPPVFGRLIPCPSWEMSFSGGKPPHSVSIASLESGNIFKYSVTSEGHTLPYTGRRGGLWGEATVIIGHVNDMLGAKSAIIDFGGPKDTPSAGTPEVFSRCRLAQPDDMPFQSSKPPSTPSRFQNFPDHPHMQLGRSLEAVDSSYGDTVAVAVCVSLGGTGLVAMAIVIMMYYRRRQKLLDAQDTLPRPFEITVPAATMTGASMVHGLTSVPMLNISPERVYSKRGRGRHNARREEAPTGTGSPKAGPAPTPTTTSTPSQAQPSPSRDLRTQPHQSDASLVSNRACPTSYRAPPRCCTHPDAPTPPDTSLQLDSCPQPGQSSLSPPPPVETKPQRTTGVPITRSTSVQEQHSAKHALMLSRSASEQYRGTSSVPRRRVPEYALSGRYNRRHNLCVDAFTHRPTNHLRQWHSASSVAHVHHVCSDPEEDVGEAIVFQHQDAGVMQELPPPYHKLVGSSASLEV